MTLDEEKLLYNLAFEDNHKKDVYILDVGCAAGGWGEKVVEFLKTKCTESTKNFHIFSVTGGLEQKDCIERFGNITHYRFNQFKVENIDEEFKKSYHNLTGKFDLIVANWTLQHMVDPFGTLNRLYNLLSPQKGMLLCNGFLFSYENSSLVESTNNRTDIFTTSSAITLFQKRLDRKLCDYFLLLRTNDKPLNLPIMYTGEIRKLDPDYDCNSQSTTVFKHSPRLPKIHLHNYKVFTKNGYPYSDYYYCQNNDIKAQELMTQLFTQKLISTDLFNDKVTIGEDFTEFTE